MGIMDSIGNLGGLGQITKVFDPGHIVKEVVDGVLPKNMHVVGDIAGAIVDIKTGNLLGAAQLGMDAIHDLPAATKSLQQQGNGAATNGSRDWLKLPPELEPDAPKFAFGDGKQPDMGLFVKAVEQLLAALKGKGASGASETKADGSGASAGDTKTDTSSASSDKKTDTSSASTTSKPDTTATSSSKPDTTTASSSTSETTSGHQSGWRPAAAAAVRTGVDTLRNAETSATPHNNGWRGEPVARHDQAPAPSRTEAGGAPNAAPASSGAPSSTPSAPTPAADHPSEAAPASSSEAPAGASGGETIKSMAQLNAMSDGAIRDAVIHGRISPEFAKDQAGMMALQQRMNAITEMNNLMTAMMRAIHDMQMAVIQNIRI